MLRSVTVRVWMAWAMAGVLVLSLAFWYFARDRLPPEIRIATGAPGGLYYQCAGRLGEALTRHTGRPVKLVETKGSAENAELLASGGADIAFLQSGAVPMDGLRVLAPMYLEPLHVIVRVKDGAEPFIASLRDLRGRAVAIGPEGSGMRESAKALLAHYRVPLDSLTKTEAYFTELASDPQLEAAIVTTGLLNPDLQVLLDSGRFVLLPVHDAQAIALRHAYLSAAEIPRGFFCEGPAVPAEPVPTVATTAVLAVKENASHLLAREVLAARFESALAAEFPTILPKQEAAAWNTYPLHPAAHDYHQPYEGIGLLANFMESIAAIKELLFAFGAGLYLLWDRWRRLKEREAQAALQKAKEHLDNFLKETIRIERAQMNETGVAQLEGYLGEITRIKLQALDELTHEDLRGDRLFTIFLTQCANVIRKIQTKLLIAVYREKHAASPEVPPQPKPPEPSEPPASE